MLIKEELEEIDKEIDCDYTEEIVCPYCGKFMTYEPYFKKMICGHCGQYQEPIPDEQEFETNYDCLKSINDAIRFACVIFKQYVTLGTSHIKFVEWLQEPYNPEDFK